MNQSVTSRNFWTPNEDAILGQQTNLQLAQGILHDWNSIANSLPGRSNKDCRKRWLKLSKQINKGTWTKEEDKQLSTAVQQHGQRWTAIAEVVATRSPDQCAKRWRHFLDPEIDHSEWGVDDEARLARAVQLHGRDWKLIGEVEFPRRSPTDLKNKYLHYERKRNQAPLELGHGVYNTSASSKIPPFEAGDLTDHHSSTFEDVTDTIGVACYKNSLGYLGSPENDWSSNKLVLSPGELSLWPERGSQELGRFDFNLDISNASTGMFSEYGFSTPPTACNFTAPTTLETNVYRSDSYNDSSKFTLVIEDLEQESANEIIQLMFSKGFQMNFKVQSQLM